MRTIGASAKRTLAILALFAMIPSSGFAFRGRGVVEKPKGPPQEAIAACADLNEGDAVQFTSSRGDTVSGICRNIRGELIAVPEKGFHGMRGGTGPGKRIDRMARELSLTEAQKEQVKAILEAARAETAPLRRQLAETRNNLREAIEAQPFDEAAVRALAESRNETRVELVVSRARAKSHIYALLSPEQREKAGKLRPGGHGRHGHRSWCR